MKQRRKKSGSGALQHCRKNPTHDKKRIKVSVLAQDMSLVRWIAAVLRRGGVEAQRLRGNLQRMASSAATDQDLIAFLRASPLVGIDLDLERDKSTGRLT